MNCPLCDADAMTGLHGAGHCSTARRTGSRRRVRPLDGPDGLRCCSACRERKPATGDFFQPIRARANGALSSWCRVCAAKKAKEYAQRKGKAETLKTLALAFGHAKIGSQREDVARERLLDVLRASVGQPNRVARG